MFRCTRKVAVAQRAACQICGRGAWMPLLLTLEARESLNWQGASPRRRCLTNPRALHGENASRPVSDPLGWQGAPLASRLGWGATRMMTLSGPRASAPAIRHLPLAAIARRTRSQANARLTSPLHGPHFPSTKPVFICDGQTIMDRFWNFQKFVNFRPNFDTFSSAATIKSTSLIPNRT